MFQRSRSLVVGSRQAEGSVVLRALALRNEAWEKILAGLGVRTRVVSVVFLPPLIGSNTANFTTSSSELLRVLLKKFSFLLHFYFVYFWKIIVDEPSMV